MGYLTKNKIVAIIAYIMIIAGMIGIGWGFMPSEDSGDVTIPAGEGYYAGTKVSFWLNGHISGTYEVVSGGGNVQLFVLNSEQYEEYAWDLVPSDSLDEDIGSSGDFSADMADTSTYYIVVNHVPGPSVSDQVVKITYKVTGIDLKFLIGGVIVLVIGAALAVVSLRMKAKAKTIEPGPPPPESQPPDVTMFDTKRQS